MVTRQVQVEFFRFHDLLRFFLSLTNGSSFWYVLDCFGAFGT